MWRWLSRILLASGFLAVVGVAMWNGRGATAQEGGNERLFFPLMEHADGTLRHYLGVGRHCRDIGEDVCFSSSEADYFTVRGDGSAWEPLTEDALIASVAWSPDGLHFVYAKASPQEPATFQTWLIPLATRHPELLLDGTPGVLIPAWSPDSRLLALVGTTEFYIYDVEAGTVTTYSLPIAVTQPLVQSVVWSADSQRFAWAGGHEVWMWVGRGDGPKRVFAGDSRTYPQTLFWSPDGSRLLINTIINRNLVLYESNADGDPAQIFLEGYRMQGWLDSGARMVLDDERWVYIANADGGSLYLFFNNGTISRVIPAPDGEFIAMYGTHSTQLDGLYLKPTTFAPHTFFEGCYPLDWRDDGDQLACSGVNRLRFSIIQIEGDSPTVERTISEYVPSAQFLPESDHLIGMDRFRGTGLPYPAPSVVFDGSYLYSMITGQFKTLQSPTGDKYPVLEWRYLP